MRETGKWFTAIAIGSAFALVGLFAYIVLTYFFLLAPVAPSNNLPPYKVEPTTTITHR